MCDIEKKHKPSGNNYIIVKYESPETTKTQHLTWTLPVYSHQPQLQLKMWLSIKVIRICIKLQ